MLRRDPIEDTEEYKKAMKVISPILDRYFPPEEAQMGSCFKVWAMQKRLLAERGIIWKDPSEMNPDVMFD